MVAIWPDQATFCMQYDSSNGDMYFALEGLLGAEEGLGPVHKNMLM